MDNSREPGRRNSSVLIEFSPFFVLKFWFNQSLANIIEAVNSPDNVKRKGFMSYAVIILWELKPGKEPLTFKRGNHIPTLPFFWPKTLRKRQ